MKKLFVIQIGVFLSIANIQAQDTVRVACSDRAIGLASSSLRLFQFTGGCDSVFVLNKTYYRSLLSETTNFKEFYAIFQQYKETRKAADADMTSIIESYDHIIKTKDEAFGTLYNEYARMNKLLDTSVGQTKKAVTIGETTLKEVKEINGKLQTENLKLNESIQHMKDIAQREKLNAGLTGGIIGGSAALFVGGIIGGILGYNLSR